MAAGVLLSQSRRFAVVPEGRRWSVWDQQKDDYRNEQLRGLTKAEAIRYADFLNREIGW